jgi:4-hydroxy-tetrahydrodipicolinate synthase
MMRMIAAVRHERPEFSFLTGWEAALMPMLLVGCDGGTNATSGIVPEITRRLYDLTLAGDLETARDLQYRLLRLFDAMLYSAEFPEGFRVALNLRGIQTGPGRQPQSSVQQQSLSKLQDQLYGLLKQEGWAEDLPSEDQIAHIVRQVLADLQRTGW